MFKHIFDRFCLYIDQEKFYKENYSYRVSEFLNGQNSNIFSIGLAGSGETYSLGIANKKRPLEIGGRVLKRMIIQFFSNTKSESVLQISVSEIYKN